MNLRRLAPPVVFASLLASGCGARTPERPNLILVSIDTLRADHLGCYAYSRETSPNLDRLAREGVLFEHAYASAPWTLPSHTSLFTGLYASEHGVVARQKAVDERHELLPEALGTLGYRSAAVVSAVPFLRRSYGFAQGWIDYDDHSAYVRKPRHAAEVHRATLRQLDRLGKGPFFLFVHHFDVHGSYSPPPPYRTMFGPRRRRSGAARTPAFRRELRLALYDGEIRWVDQWIGELIAELERRDLLERTIVAVVSDHGEEFGEHGAWRHGDTLYDGALRVPWIVRFPGARYAGTRVGAPVSLVDVPATLLALAGGGSNGWRSGRNVAPWIEAGAPPPADAALFASRRFDDAKGLQAILADGYKAIFKTDGSRLPQLPPIGLYRLATDPGEATDLAATQPAVLAALFERLRNATLDQLRRERQLPAILRGAASAEEERQFRAFGYL
jgi:arylsulfatase A-like enzyme